MLSLVDVRRPCRHPRPWAPGSGTARGGATRTPGVPGPPMSLWTEMNTASFSSRSASAGIATGRGTMRRHLDGHVGRGGGEVPEGQRAMAMEQHRDGAGVRQDAGDVGRGREGPDAQRPVGVADQLPLQVREVDAAVGVLVDGHDVRDRLPPRQLVGVVLVRADEHDRTLVGRDLVAQRDSARRAPPAGAGRARRRACGWRPSSPSPRR